jgi:hypothetical protein
MDIRTLMMSVLAGALFGGYSFFVKRSGLTWWMTGLVMHTVTLAVFMVVTAAMVRKATATREIFFRSDFTVAPETLFATVIGFALALGAVAGLMNGGGHLMFQQVIANGNRHLTQVLIIVPVVGVFVAIVFGPLVAKEPLTPWKLVAAVSAVFTIYAASK